MGIFEKKITGIVSQSSELWFTREATTGRSIKRKEINIWKKQSSLYLLRLLFHIIEDLGSNLAPRTGDHEYGFK
jgi:hypothetical protein